MELRNVVDLHVAVNAIFGEIKDPNAQPCVTDEPVKPGEFRGELFCNAVSLFQVLQLNLHGVHFGHVPELFQAGFRFLDVLFFLAEQVDRGRIVLENVGTETKANAGASASDHVDLVRQYTQ